MRMAQPGVSIQPQLTCSACWFFFARGSLFRMQRGGCGGNGARRGRDWDARAAGRIFRCCVPLREHGIETGTCCQTKPSQANDQSSLGDGIGSSAGLCPVQVGGAQPEYEAVLKAN
jgi:hypothetical protein